ncbi:hypothetical protein J437_LFUL011363 [Ladona fulva]|uniref:Uncharacterized protein n=1 Tax=Ladona fulva TaxID=123851 RepID=A0A8K0KJ18_LADFU|nr:hypothetical protein J437_LFUL011363 [Ladona fulva]
MLLGNHELPDDFIQKKIVKHRLAPPRPQRNSDIPSIGVRDGVRGQRRFQVHGRHHQFLFSVAPDGISLR